MITKPREEPVAVDRKALTAVEEELDAHPLAQIVGQTTGFLCPDVATAVGDEFVERHNAGKGTHEENAEEGLA